MTVKVVKELLHTALSVSVVAFVCEVFEIDWQLALISIRDSALGRGTTMPQLQLDWSSLRNWINT